VNGLRLGLARGWIGFRGMVTSGEGVFQYAVFCGVPLAVLLVNGGSTIPGTGIALSAALLPSLLALMLSFGVTGTATMLASEREDGTLLRAKAVPGGMSTYVIGLCAYAVLDGVLSLGLVLVPALVLVPGPAVGPAAWAGLLGYVLLGLAAVLPLGLLIGSVVRNPRVIGGLGFAATGALATVSGLFFPVQALWGWVQVLVQAFPVYWLGLGLRSTLLPAEAAALEVGGSWRTLETIAVLGAWSAVGLVLGPVLLRRMARRESGSAVQARRTQALQRA
jgi:ABC-2 type transport system permease protein